MTMHRFIIYISASLIIGAITLSNKAIGQNEPMLTADYAQEESRILFQLAKAGSKDDGKATPASQAKAAKKALKQSKGKVLKVQRGQGGFTVKVLTGSGKVQHIWIAD